MTFIMTPPRIVAPPLGLFPGQSAPRLYDRVAEVLRTRHYSRRTEEAYLQCICRFLVFHTGTHPRELAESDVQTAMIYTHVLNRGGRGDSPLDRFRKAPSSESGGGISRTKRSA